jgi:hypothetical protein
MGKGLRKFFWGFLFIMLGFRVKGFDILPDVVGFVLFAQGFKELSDKSHYFKVAARYNTTMIVLSLFSIYQPLITAEGNSAKLLMLLEITLTIAAFTVNLNVVYNLFMGIRIMVQNFEQGSLYREAYKKWNQYKLIQVALLAFEIIVLIPIVNIIYILTLYVLSIAFLICIWKYFNKCVFAEVVEESVS